LVICRKLGHGFILLARPGTNAMDLPVPPPDPASRDGDEAQTEISWLAEIAERLESNPEDCWNAFEGLAAVEPEVRVAIIETLSALSPGTGASRLLRLLSSSRDPASRAAARSALEHIDDKTDRTFDLAPSQPAPPLNGETANGCWLVGVDRTASLPVSDNAPAPRLVGSLVTPVDGRGLGSVIVSVSNGGQRRTAAFLCDVRWGIRDVVGEVEPESAHAGGLLDASNPQPDGGCARDVHELALRFLAGSLMLCRQAVPRPVREWLIGTLGPAFQPASVPMAIPGIDISSISLDEMPDRVASVLDLCPSWLDRSPLTFELAREVLLREGKAAGSPERDAGAYRFLFEHRLIHRVELYRLMLLWMAWLWRYSSDVELARSALALACQLSDEQYAVPSHPFTVELTMRSLMAAQVSLYSESRPRSNPR
jgi:hypothetical protein